MTNAPETAQPEAARTATAMQFVRGLFHLIAIASVTVWGFMAWPLPWPGILSGVGFLALSVVVWALFLSPRPMLRTDRFGQALIELMLLGAAVAALLDLGLFWPIPVVFGIAGAVVGYLASAKK